MRKSKLEAAQTRDAIAAAAADLIRRTGIAEASLAALGSEMARSGKETKAAAPSRGRAPASSR